MKRLAITLKIDVPDGHWFVSSLFMWNVEKACKCWKTAWWIYGVSCVAQSLALSWICVVSFYMCLVMHSVQLWLLSVLLSFGLLTATGNTKSIQQWGCWLLMMRLWDLFTFIHSFVHSYLFARQMRRSVCATRRFRREQDNKTMSLRLWLPFGCLKKVCQMWIISLKSMAEDDADCFFYSLY